ncbi:uncharacterized protein [Drosophila takahashii]|uniref:uncharacterized protein n=1 Tax=Drosophila takahashii TaxID=29030 RepID=UPI001CF84C9F|nr:uncharacterized protein LOC108069491 [Drosophila takahashii]
MLSTKPVRVKSMAKKKSSAQKKPKTDPQQQRFLKTRFQSANRPISKQSSVPPSQRIWRRTVVQKKPKQKTRIPKLFRMDRHTGLPVDYERTVHQVMHYVNPHLASRPNPEQVLEHLLAKMLAEILRQGGHQNANSQLRSLLHDHCNCHRTNTISSKEAQSQREANESLSQFHSACKRGPCRLPRPKLGPTYMSKFNFNQLKIKSF